MDEIRFKNEFLNRYLEYVEDTESPRIFHLWSVLSALGAAMGRRCYFPFGAGGVYPNMYVLLVGPPAVRKSTAIKWASRLLKDNTTVRFMPNDTAGQRQGILAAMSENEQVDELLEEFDRIKGQSIESLMEDASSSALEKLGNLTVDMNDKHVMYVTANEFSSFTGVNNLELLTFLIEMWDGVDEYRYQTKAGKVTLDKPLLNIIGATTPTLIAETMPAAAMGQGFMSRIMLVHSSDRYKRIAFPSPPNEILSAELGNIFSMVNNNFAGEFNITPIAKRFLEDIYEHPFETSDPRFVYYAERRFTHLLKLSMVLASSRLSQTIEEQDVIEGELILKLTEASMPDALGEFGLSPLSAAKQKLIEFIVHSKVPLSPDVLWAVMQRDMKRVDFISIIADLLNSGKILSVDTDNGPAYYAKEKKAKVETDQLLQLLWDKDD